MALRGIILQIHLYLGLIAGLFLLILGLTGSVMAFEADIIHWMNPELWYVTPAQRTLPENDLISIVQNRFPGTPVVIVQFSRASNLAQLMQLTDGTAVYVNPYDGNILGSTTRRSNLEKTLGYIHQIHLRLVPEPRDTPKLADAGKIVVSIAGLFLCFLVPTGVTLWWRSKKASIQWRAATNFKVPWYRIFYDAHQTIGIYAAFFLLLSSLTGILIGFDTGNTLFYGITRSERPAPPRSVASTVVKDATPLMADEILGIAHRQMPNATFSALVRPIRPAGSYTVMMRVPEETSESVHSSVTIDQYNGKVLQVRSFLNDSTGYRLIRFNRSLHTGDIFGLPSHIIVSLSSLMLVAMVITGVVIWYKKLA